MYLNNDSDDHKELQNGETKRKELITNCKLIRRILENEFKYLHPHDDVDSNNDSSYLEMNGVKNRHVTSCDDIKNSHQESDEKKEDDESSKEYIEMNHRKSENAYNIYEATTTLELDSEQCPFTGLPAVHLKLMCSPIAGLLTKIEKKLFFAQTKDFYAGILDKWILLYPSKSNDMKPSDYFYPKNMEITKGDNHQFIIVTNSDKRYHFQAPNSEEFYEWVVNINRIIDELTTGKCRESQFPQLLSRKLPSLPHVDKKEESYYVFGNTPQSINSNEERLYEEPCSSSMKDEADHCEKNDENAEKNDENFEKKAENSELYEEKPPELPIKTGKKISSENCEPYDTPKSNKPINSVEEEQSPRGVRVSEMTAILSTITLVSPEEKRKSIIKEKKIIESPTIYEKKNRSKSPMKNWFTKRILRGKKQIIEEQEEEEEEENSEMLECAKGSKVNMIINQLEKSGQLSALKKGYKSRKTLVFDKCNEECIKNRN